MSQIFVVVDKERGLTFGEKDFRSLFEVDFDQFY